MCRIHYQNNKRISHVCSNICNDIKLHFHDSDSRIFNFNLLMQRAGTYVFTSFTYQNFFEAIIIFGPSTQKTLANRIHSITHLAGTTAHQSTGRNMQQGQHCQKSGYGYNNRRNNEKYFFHFDLLSTLLFCIKFLPGFFQHLVEYLYSYQDTERCYVADKSNF